MLLPTRAQNSLEDEDTEYVIDKQDGNKQITTRKFYQVRWYEYDPTDDTLEHEINTSKHFVERYSRSKVETKFDSYKWRGRQITN